MTLQLPYIDLLTGYETFLVWVGYINGHMQRQWCWRRGRLLTFISADTGSNPSEGKVLSNINSLSSVGRTSYSPPINVFFCSFSPKKTCCHYHLDLLKWHFQSSSDFNLGKTTNVESAKQRRDPPSPSKSWKPWKSSLLNTKQIALEHLHSKECSLKAKQIEWTLRMSNWSHLLLTHDTIRVSFQICLLWTIVFFYWA